VTDSVTLSDSLGDAPSVIDIQDPIDLQLSDIVQVTHAQQVHVFAERRRLRSRVGVCGRQGRSAMGCLRVPVAENVGVLGDLDMVFVADHEDVTL